MLLRCTLALGVLVGLAGCADMNRTVGVLPNTLDGLARQRAAAPADTGTTPPRPGAPAPVQPGDRALIDTQGIR